MKNLKNLKLFSFILVILSMLSVAPNRADHSVELPNSVRNYLTKYKYLSVELNQQTGIPIPIILAIAGLESGWGNSDLALSANNHFGIKTKDTWRGRIYCKPTLEYINNTSYFSSECFRKYSLIRESYSDFGNFITQNPNYQSLTNLPSWNYRAWAEGLQDKGYATDPAYAEKLLRLIWRYELYELDV